MVDYLILISISADVSTVHSVRWHILPELADWGGAFAIGSNIGCWVQQPDLED